MTDIQIVQGIKENSEQAWRYIYREYNAKFCRFFVQQWSADSHTADDLFQDACMVLLHNVQADKYTVRLGATLYSYLLAIGKNLMKSHSRQRREDTTENPIDAGITDDEIQIDEQQMEQDRFLEQLITSLPMGCQKLLKQFYFDRMPFDEIASQGEYKNADSAKTQKNKCMNKLKEFAARLINDDEYAEDVVRAAVNRLAVKEIMEEERSDADEWQAAALDAKPDTDKDN